MEVEIFDNRQRGGTLYKPREPLVSGNILTLESWDGSVNLLLKLDTGYAVSITKKALERIMPQLRGMLPPGGKSGIPD